MPTFECYAVYCGKNYGCGRNFCSDHGSKQFFAKPGKNAPPVRVCLEDEAKAYRCSCIYYIAPLGVILLTTIVFIIFMA